MQFHLNGFKPGDPDTPAETTNVGAAGTTGPLPEKVDVLIVGAGPAGLTLAAQLSAFPAIHTCVIEQKAGPLQLGQADGIACRTMEMFEAFNFSERVLKEAYFVNEVTFWQADEHAPEKLSRHGRIQDVEDGLSEFPHVILNQARIHDFYLDVMRNASTPLVPFYSRTMQNIQVESADSSHPVTVHTKTIAADGTEQTESVKANYVVGCDGARSAVRQSIGLDLKGDSANQAWGVMDVLAVTDFPDIRLKTTIKSTAGENLIIIPREGGYLVRLYVELGSLKNKERVTDRDISLEQVINAARRIFKPYTLDVKEVVWWSVYEIGQRISDQYDNQATPSDHPHVFIAGDACHTHSPKAGQGMNFSMQDSFNLGWKLAAVLRGHSEPALLGSYSAERQPAAQELLDFDREWAKMFKKGSPEDIEHAFVRQGRYTAGVATRYQPSAIIGKPNYQSLAAGFEIGTRFHSAPVIRVADARPVHLGHAGKADGRWRLYAFADNTDPTHDGSNLRALCNFLATSPDSPVLQYTPTHQDKDSIFDFRAVFQTEHQAIDLESMPEMLLPRKGVYQLIDYEKVFSADTGRGDIFESRTINREQGCVVIVRPDQYVAHVLPLTSTEALANFFKVFMVKQH